MFSLLYYYRHSTFPLVIEEDQHSVCWGHFHLKVHSVSIAAFRISLAISAHFVWISNKNFSFCNVSHKSLSFVTWNLIEYLHTQDFQRATAHLNVWTNISFFCFVYGCKQHTKISQQNWREGNLFSLFALPSTLNPFY